MGLLYEDFPVGASFTTKSTEVTRDEIISFAKLSGDDNPLHTDVEYARSVGFPDILAHGPFVQSRAVGLIAETGKMAGSAVALLKISATFKKPVFPGDRLHASVRVTRKRPTSRPDRGVLWRRVDVINQDGDVTASLLMVTLLRRRMT